MRNVLSLFNGISGLHLALDKANIKVDNVYYAEIDKFANKVTEHHYPNDVALGDVTKWKDWNIDWSTVDLVSAGFPCQAWSMAGKQLGDKDERGMLFWTTLNIIKTVLEHNPKAKFLMENVKMKKEFEEYITHHTEQALGYVEKTLINSSLVSAQNRNRYYWTNFRVTQPEDIGLKLGDILEVETDEVFKVNESALSRYTDENGKVKGLKTVEDKSGCLTASMHKGFGNDGCTVVKCGALRGRYIVDGKRQDSKMKTAGLTTQRLDVREDFKTNYLTTVQKDNVVYDEIYYRKLTPLECERLQTVPDNWTSMLSNTQRYKSLGNGWTIDVIAHILKCI